MEEKYSIGDACFPFHIIIFSKNQKSDCCILPQHFNKLVIKRNYNTNIKFMLVLYKRGLRFQYPISENMYQN